jgi:imidazolonepropionase-like amidohydrolase
LILKADRVFDGKEMHSHWLVAVRGNKIIAAGAESGFPRFSKSTLLVYSGATLLPGLIEGHSHILLHPYNETSWDDQVLKESRAERVARATNHLRNTLLAGFTTIRDLGTEGAMYDDVGLKNAVEKGIIPGPRMIVVTRAIVATGSYGPENLNSDLELPKAAAEEDGNTLLVKEVRKQIGNGADVIKVYADYRWGLEDKAEPTFTQDELNRIVEVTNSSGRYVAAHATTRQGMKRAILAGVHTIEHGDDGDAEIFNMMKEKNIALCATLAAGEFVAQYRGWKKGIDEEPGSIKKKKESFKQALQSGVTICFGGDVGVYTHGNNAVEMELMADYGMQQTDILRSATSINAAVFGLDDLGEIKKDKLADMIIVQGNPAERISDIRNIKLVMKNGIVYKK